MVLRDRFETARRNADRSRAMAAVQEVRAHVLLAVSILKERLGPIERAASENNLEWLVRTYPDWSAKRHLLMPGTGPFRDLPDAGTSWYHSSGRATEGARGPLAS